LLTTVFVTSFLEDVVDHALHRSDARSRRQKDEVTARWLLQQKVAVRPSEDDFVARFFAPNAGIEEDPVTGSAYTFLAPYWAKQLSKQSLSARQLSARGGKLDCEIADDRVLIAGLVQAYLSGEIVV
jgi:predicted PhzF superfamily epimerase YddE/YHI9